MIKPSERSATAALDAQQSPPAPAMTSEEGSSRRLSIIVPVYNNPQDLRECLSALLTSSCPGVEIIVVDDASTDDTLAVAAQMGVHVLALTKNSGPSAARNYGASHAQGAILFFVDADVVIAPGAVSRVLAFFAEHPDVTAVFGSYDAQPRARGVVSKYRNLLHHFTHQSGNSEASTFWSGCGAIRRSVFLGIGGFDEKRFPRCIEDIELGYRLRRAGYRIFLDKALQGTHLKRWTFWSAIRTDIFCRAVPWSRLILERKDAPDDLNLKWDQRLCVALTGLGCLLLALAPLQNVLLFLSGASFFAVIGLNRRLFTFFSRCQGPLFALGAIPLYLLYYLYSGLSYLYVWVDFYWRHTASERQRLNRSGKLPNE